MSIRTRLAAIAFPEGRGIVMVLRTWLAAAAVSVFAPMAAAFPPSVPFPVPDPVVEYFNTETGHYFYTWSPGEQQALASGAVGTGWIRTGLAFGAWGTRERALYPGDGGQWRPFDSCEDDPRGSERQCTAIVRFHAPGPNSHFFTGRPSDIAILDRSGSGWVRENVAFYAAMPNASGNCPLGTVAVHRLYNNRAAFNDSNHRYTANETARQTSAARGWVDEGIAFCAYEKRNVPVEKASFSVADPSDVMEMRGCRAAAGAGSCLGFANLPLPTHLYTNLFTTRTSFEHDQFERETGMPASVGPYVNLAVDGGSRFDAAENAFVQVMRAPVGRTSYTGIHLATQSRMDGPYSSIAAWRRLPRASLYPYRSDTGTSLELHLETGIAVQQASAGSGSHAYGVLSLQFADEASGRSLLFNILHFGTAPAGEGAGRDINTSLPFVYATMGTDSRFARLQGEPPRGIAQQLNPVWRPGYAWINQRQFQAILDAARQVEPLLSPRPEDYSVAGFGLVNEAYGDGEIGVVVWDLSLTSKAVDER